MNLNKATLQFFRIDPEFRFLGFSPNNCLFLFFAYISTEVTFKQAQETLPGFFFLLTLLVLLWFKMANEKISFLSQGI